MKLYELGKEERQDRELLLILAKVAPGQFKKKVTPNGVLKFYAADKSSEEESHDPTIEYFPSTGKIFTDFSRQLAIDVDDALTNHGWHFSRQLLDNGQQSYMFTLVYPGSGNRYPSSKAK